MVKVIVVIVMMVVAMLMIIVTIVDIIEIIMTYNNTSEYSRDDYINNMDNTNIK